MQSPLIVSSRAAARAPVWAARRALEVAPPLLVWAVVTAPLWAALLAPHLLGSFLVIFSAYWLWRSVEFSGGLLLGLWRLHDARRRDWQAELRTVPDHRLLHHLVFIPTYGESEDILADTLHHLAAQRTPLDRVTVVLAFEERDPNASERARRLTARFGPVFGYLLVTFHPDLPGEVKGKSSNLAWAARRVQDELIATGRVSARHLILTVCDADSRLHPQYLSALGHAVLSDPDGLLHVYQPALLFYANHWRLPAMIRAVNSIFSLYSLARMAPSHRLIPQSTYSLSWWAARTVGFWDPDVVPEDSHMFFKVWLHLGRRVKTRAIYLPVYADAAEGATLQRTVRTHYRQIRRWAWGVSEIPYVVLSALRARHIPWHVRVARVGWYVEEHLVWPSHWFLLTLGGLLPPLLNPAYAATEAAMQQAGAVSTLLSLCLPSLVLAMLADAWLRPRVPERLGLAGSVLSLVGFAVLPVTALALSALPALDAHTRLLLGRSLAYQVTEKLPSSRMRSTAPGRRTRDKAPAVSNDAA